MDATGEGGEDNTVNGGALVLGGDKDGWGHDDDEFGLSGEGESPPVSQLLVLVTSASWLVRYALTSVIAGMTFVLRRSV